MAAATDDFVQWALSPELNQEEAFCAELLTDHGLAAWKGANKITDPDQYDYEKRRLAKERRGLNPAHRATLREVDVMHAAEMLPQMTKLDHWTFGGGGDRLLRDASGLRFCPKLIHFQVNPTALPDLEWLRWLPELESFWLQDENLEDYSGLRHCPKLKKVALWLHFSWCDLRALADLPELEDLVLHGNLPTLAGVKPLLKVGKVYLDGFGGGRAFLHDASDLPEMPQLREGRIVPFARLDGIEKFAALEDFVTEGSFTDLTPLSRLPNLMKLVLGGERFTDLAPLARAPKLGLLQICRELPIDLTPLLDSNSLRELVPRFGEEPSLEMVSFNAALRGWESDFLLETPRELPSPVYRIADVGPDPDPRFQTPQHPRVVDPGAPLYEAEGQWVGRRLVAALERLLGDSEWGKTRCHTYDADRAAVDVELNSIEACERGPEVIECCRQQLAWLKNRWTVHLSASPKAQWEKDPEEWKYSPERELQEHLDEAHDYVDRRRRYLAYLERLKEFRLKQELGEETQPEEFAPPPPEEEEVDSDVMEAGDVFEQRHHPLWHDFYTRMHVCEEGVWAFPGFKGSNERLTGKTFEVSERQRQEYESEKED